MVCDSLAQLRKPHAIDGRQIVSETLKRVAAIATQVEITGGATEGDGVFFNRKRMAIDHIVGVILRQTTTQLLPRLAAVFCARDKQPTIDSHALLVGDARHNPSSAALLVIGGDGEAKVHATLWSAHLRPGRAAIRAVENPAVVLLPHVLRVSGAALDVVRIVTPFCLRIGQVVVAHALVASLPGLATISAFNDARGRDADADEVGVAA